MSNVLVCRFISPTRLAIHNLPFTLTDDKLRELCEVRNVTSLFSWMNCGNLIWSIQKSAGEGASVVECRIWRDLNNLDEKVSYSRYINVMVGMGRTIHDIMVLII